jgi:hypothetical protein
MSEEIHEEVTTTTPEDTTESKDTPVVEDDQKEV